MTHLKRVCVCLRACVFYAFMICMLIRGYIESYVSANVMFVQKMKFDMTPKDTKKTDRNWDVNQEISKEKTCVTLNQGTYGYRTHRNSGTNELFAPRDPFNCEIN